ncbi:MAG: hypothetical protein ETSY2_34795 [Candidatus Entotheonella gemina]|uniref:Transmembrane protein n=1 Tax=Candidatus Entotheonella gemina TaxID=1429439 RepID=W4LZI4_9BACT|nr:MAG: hypothetical protein ETSY2_34795 [Candidatus Entotheonella gemina]
MKEEEFVKNYIHYITQQLPKVLIVTFGLSLIPIIGLIIGLIYSRLSIIAPFQQYIPIRQKLISRWMLKILFFFLITIHFVPLIGGFVAPIISYINFYTFKSLFLKQIKPGDKFQYITHK